MLKLVLGGNGRLEHAACVVSSWWWGVCVAVSKLIEGALLCRLSVACFAQEDNKSSLTFRMLLGRLGGAMTLCLSTRSSCSSLVRRLFASFCWYDGGPLCMPGLCGAGA